MIDREKVIKGLECCKDIHTAGPGYAQGCIFCPYGETPSDGAGGYACFRAMVKDALVLLKAQEPKPPIITENAYGWKFYHCPSCGREFYGDRLHGRMTKTAFCDKCGQAVKWDD